MKKSMFVLMVAIVAVVLLSAPVQGQEKNESLIVSWAVEPSVAMKGQPVTLTARVAKGVPPYRLELNGHLVQNPHTFIPDSTASYGATLSDSAKLRVPYAFKLPVLDYQKYDFEVLTLRDNETDVTRAVTWDGVVKQIANINESGDFEVAITPTADRITTVSSRSMKGQKGIEANRAYQDSIGNERGKSAYRELLAIGVKNIKLEKPIIERPKGEKGVIISLRETKASLARRFSEARQEVASMNTERTVKAAADSSPKPSKTPAAITIKETIVIGEQKADRIRLTITTAYGLEEVPLVGIGVRIPLNQDTSVVKSDIHSAVYLGYNGRDYGWSITTQVDFRLGHGFYAAPILNGGQNFPEFGAVANYAEISLGGVLQYRLTNKVVAEIGAACGYRTYHRVDEKKIRPDETGAKLLAKIYYAF